MVVETSMPSKSVKFFSCGYAVNCKVLKHELIEFYKVSITTIFYPKQNVLFCFFSLFNKYIWIYTKCQCENEFIDNVNFCQKKTISRKQIPIFCETLPFNVCQTMFLIESD
jgi:hypothetical protein